MERVALGMSGTASSVWTLPPVIREFISEDKSLLRICIENAPEPVSDCYVEQDLNDKHSDRLGVPTERYVSLQKMI